MQVNEIWRTDDESRSHIVDNMIAFCVRNRLDLTILHSAVYFFDTILIRNSGKAWQLGYEEKRIIALSCLSVADKYHMDLYKGTAWFACGVCDSTRLGSLEFEVCRRLGWHVGAPTPWSILYTQWACIHRDSSILGYGLPNAHTRDCHEIDASCKLVTALLLNRYITSLPVQHVVDFVKRVSRWRYAHTQGILSEDARMIEHTNDAIALGHVLNGAIREIGGVWPELIHPHRPSFDRSGTKRARDA